MTTRQSLLHPSRRRSAQLSSDGSWLCSPSRTTARSQWPRRGLSLAGRRYTKTTTPASTFSGTAESPTGDVLSTKAATQVPASSRSAFGLRPPRFSMLPRTDVADRRRRLSRSRHWQPRGCSTVAAAATPARRPCAAKTSASAVAGRSAGSVGNGGYAFVYTACANSLDEVTPRHTKK